MAQQDSGQGPTVFWSWQSDYDEKSCRYFVRDALKEAIAQIADGMRVEPADRPSLDHDTKDARGMVDIKSVILEKIQRCSLFVADLTPISKTDKGKWVPNPNVMIELGWAMHSPGYEHVIPVLNVASGCAIKDLPFDIQGRRVVAYELGSATSTVDRKKQYEDLVALLRQEMEKELKRQADITVATKIAALDIQGAAADPHDRSIWRVDSGLVHHQEQGRSIGVSFADEPRAFVRSIPESASGRLPRLSAFEKASVKNLVRPHFNGKPSGGSLGLLENGHIEYWWIGGDSREMHNATMYFENSGEIWSFNGGVFFEDSESRTIIDMPTMLREFYRLICGSIEVQDSLGWPAARRLEVGFVSRVTPYVHLPIEGKLMSRKKTWVFERTRASWGKESLDEFFADMVDSFFSLFGMQPPEPEQVKNLLVVR